MSIPTIHELFDLTHTKASPFLEKLRYGHEILEDLSKIILTIGGMLDEDYEEIAPRVFSAKDARISPLSTVEGPTVIGHKAEIRPGAYIRGAALIGDGCVVGNSTEIKNAILFDGAQAPHYNYVGDSILGYCAHMGAGSILSNLRADKADVVLTDEDESVNTGRRKIGGMIGDHAEIGCGAVLCPGAIVGKECIVYPLALVRGALKARSILKNTGEITQRI